jgi:hypothetical protein
MSPGMRVARIPKEFMTFKLYSKRRMPRHWKLMPISRNEEEEEERE